MPDEIEERIEEIIDRKLGLYQPKNRRTANEIRDRIQGELEKRPKTSHELKNALGATRSTVENHCQHLEALEVADERSVNGQKYWFRK